MRKVKLIDIEEAEGRCEVWLGMCKVWEGGRVWEGGYVRYGYVRYGEWVWDGGYVSYGRWVCEVWEVGM